MVKVGPLSKILILNDLWQKKRNTINDRFQIKTMTHFDCFKYVIDVVQDNKRQQFIFSRTNILFKLNKFLNSLLDRIEQVYKFIKSFREEILQKKYFF